MNSVLELKNVTAGYRRDNPVIREVDLAIPERDFLAIIGPNGGGKTTLLKVMLGLLEPWNGTVELFGQSPARTRSRVGYVPQVVPEEGFPVTVLDVVLMGRLKSRKVLKRFGTSDREKAAEYLEKLDIQDLAEKDMNSLSGGQKQRVLIARALVGQPEMLLLDEPVASVDHETQESFFNLLAKLNSAITIVLVTHDVGGVSSHVKNIACINSLLVSHGADISSESVARAYGCPFELISHGELPHRVLERGMKEEDQ